MLRTFFDLGFKDKAFMFSSSAIARDKSLCDEYQNKYPVISVSLKDTESDRYETLLNRLCVKFREEVVWYWTAITSKKNDRWQSPYHLLD